MSSSVAIVEIEVKLLFDLARWGLLPIPQGKVHADGLTTAQGGESRAEVRRLATEDGW